MANTLQGKKVAVLVTDGFEQVELTDPVKALKEEGAEVKIFSDKSGKVKGWNHDKPGDDIPVDGTFSSVNIEEYDAVLLPGGVMNSDQIRVMPEAQQLVKQAAQDGKTVAVICHGAWLLVSAGLVEGHTLTSWESLKDDIQNAGGKWVDEAVVKDGHFISSRKPDDIPQFNRELIETLAA